MKFLTNTRTITLGLMGSAILLFSSCLKDTGPVQDFSTSAPVISFQTDGQGGTSTSVAVLGTSSQTSPAVDSVEVSLGVASLYLKTSVQVSVSAPQASLDAYNAANGTSYILLPAADYSIQNSGTVTIPSGKNLINFGVSFFGSSIDFTQSYALPLTITGATGGGSVVASNLNVYVLIITPANQYSGNYRERDKDFVCGRHRRLGRRGYGVDRRDSYDDLCHQYHLTDSVSRSDCRLYGFDGQSG